MRLSGAAKAIIIMAVVEILLPVVAAVVYNMFD